MKALSPVLAMATEQDQRISDALQKENARLRNFIRRRVPDVRDAEDVFQDVFYELVRAYRAAEKIEQVSAWLFRVARNKITDLFRKRRPGSTVDQGDSRSSEGGDPLNWEETLASGDAGPEDALLQSLLADELEQALAELPDEQQFVFVANEMEGRSFQEIAAETGVSVNTLLSRKRYAVLHLRRRLRAIYEDFNLRSKR